MFEALKQELISSIEPVLNQMKINLVDLRIGMYGNVMNLRVFADKESGGINIAECTSINRQLVQEIDKRNLIGGDYTIEVSSPGLDWPLKTAKDFKRVLNRKVRFHLTEALEGKIEYSGEVKEILDQSVKIQIKDREMLIPIDKIHKALQIVE
jgi:ribosome maturation factor RimP